MSTFSWVYKPYTFWDPVPTKKMSTHQHYKNKWSTSCMYVYIIIIIIFFLVSKFTMKIIKLRPKSSKCRERMLIFTDPATHPRKCMVCTLVKMLIFMDGRFKGIRLFISHVLIAPLTLCIQCIYCIIMPNHKLLFV